MEKNIQQERFLLLVASFILGNCSHQKGRGAHSHLPERQWDRCLTLLRQAPVCFFLHRLWNSQPRTKSEGVSSEPPQGQLVREEQTQRTAGTSWRLSNEGGVHPVGLRNGLCGSLDSGHPVLATPDAQLVYRTLHPQHGFWGLPLVLTSARSF